MKLLAFSVYDEKVQAFNAPFFQTTLGQAVRSYSDIVNDAESVIHRHPGDYVLYHMGEFDDGEGTFTSQVPPVRLGSGLEYVEVKPGGEVPVRFGKAVKR